MKKNVIPIFFIVFVDLVGLGLVIPLFAPLLLSDQGLAAGLDFRHQSILLGFLLACYPFMQFFGSPILGAYSDKFGRKPILYLTLLGIMISYLISGYAILIGNLPLLFLSRCLCGLFSGNLSIAFSAIADETKPSERASHFGIIGMAFGFGFIVGPFLGGKLSDQNVLTWFNLSTPFFAAALFSLINILLVWLLFRETLRQKQNTRISLLSGLNNVRHAFSMPNLRVLFGVIFLYWLGFNFFTQFFQVFLIEKFSYTQIQIGNMFAYIGIWIAFAQGVFSPFVSKRYAPTRILSVSLLLLACLFPLLLLPDKSEYLYLIFPFIALMQGLNLPNSNALVSNLAGKEAQGRILGINQSVQSLAMTFPPIIAGFLAAIHPTFPILAASVFVGICWLLFYFVFRRQHKDIYHEE